MFVGYPHNHASDISYVESYIRMSLNNLRYHLVKKMFFPKLNTNIEIGVEYIQENAVF
jgi:hypothetical protein